MTVKLNKEEQDKYNSRANAFQVEDNDIISKLLNENIEYVVIPNPKYKSKEQWHKEIHNNIKEEINYITDIDIKYINNYTWFKSEKNDIVALFLSDNDNNLKLTNYTKNISKKDKNQIVLKLIEFHIQRKIIKKIEESGNSIDLNLYNGNIYLASTVEEDKKSKGYSYVSLLKPVFNYYKDVFTFNFMEKQYRLKNAKIYNSEHAGLPLVLNTKNEFFINDDKDEKCREMDSRKRQKKYMPFTTQKEGKDKYDYTVSINYIENYIAHLLKNIFKELKINAEQLEFNPTESFDITQTFNQTINNITVIDNYEYSDIEKNLKKEFYSEIKKSFKIQGIESDIVSVIDIDISKLDTNKNYLILNTLTADNNSIKYKNKEGKQIKIDSFIKAKIAYDKDQSIEFDFYTKLKLYNFNKNIDKKIIIQGVDIDSISKKDKETGSILYKSKQFEISSTKEKKTNKSIPKTSPIVNKLILEINFKRNIFKDRKIKTNAEDNNFYALYTRAYSDDRKTKRIYSLAEISIKDDLINIVKSSTHNDGEIGCIEKEFPFLENLPSLKNNDNFILFNKDKCFCYYSNNNVPQVISDKKNNYEEYHKIGKEYINKKGASKILTLYNPLKDHKEKVFIQNEKSMNTATTLLFITASQGANAEINNRNLMYDCFVVDSEGEYHKALNDSLFNSFLDTLTIDYLKLKETSKTSLIKKLCKELIGE